VLCGASTSATYDLTRALEHVKHRLYIFTSEKDAVLRFLVPMAGTADRVSGRIPSAGLHGFSLPARASEWTRQQYAKSVTIPWRPDFAQLGYRGGHTDVLSAHFVAAQIAPRLMQEAGTTPAKLASTYDKVPNPDYERWAGFAVGSYSVLEGYQQYRDIRSAVRVKEILRSKSADRLELHREFFLTDEHATVPSHVLSVIAEAWIKPQYHPITDPAAVRSTLPAREISVKGRAYRCLGRRVEASGQYPDWGSDLVGTVYRAETLPGGIAMLELRSHLQGEPFVFEGRAVDFELTP